MPMKHIMQLKKAGLAAVVLALAVSLSACGGGGGSASSGSTLAEGSNPVVNGSGSGSDLASSQVSQPEERHMMTIDETEDFFRQLTPQQLGLEGESLDQYEIYPSEKAVPVNGMPCMKLVVYEKSEAGTNAPVSTYLVARDGTAVYEIQDGIAVDLEVF